MVFEIRTISNRSTFVRSDSSKEIPVCGLSLKPILPAIVNTGISLELSDRTNVDLSDIVVIGLD